MRLELRQVKEVNSVCNQSKHDVNVTGIIDLEYQQKNHNIGGQSEYSNVFIGKTTVDPKDTIKVLDSSKNNVENNTIHGNKQEVQNKSSSNKSTESVGNGKILDMMMIELMFLVVLI